MIALKTIFSQETNIPWQGDGKETSGGGRFCQNGISDEETQPD